MSATRLLQVIVVTPEATVLRREATFVALPLYDGEIGVGPGRAELIGRLGYGEMRILEGTRDTVRYYVDGGFVQVADDVISVLTNRAILAEEIDTDAAEAQLQDARSRKSNSTELMEIRDRLEAQARAQLRVAGHGDS